MPANGWLRLTLLGVLKRGASVDSAAMRLKLRRLDDLCSRLREVGSDERGVALVMALGIMLVLIILVTSILVYSAASARDSQRSNASEHAHSLAEAGVHSALAVLNAAYPDLTDPFPGNSCLLHPQATTYAGYDATTDASLCSSPTPFTTAYDGGSCTAPITSCVTWSGALQQTVTGKSWPSQWIIRAVGSVANPSGPSTNTIQRVVTVKVPVVIPPAGPIPGDDALNWLYAGSDVQFSNSVLIGSPLYAGRDLTLSNSAAVCGFAGNMVVGRNLSLTSPSDKVGLVPDGTGNNPSCPKATGNTTDPRIAQAHVAGTCSQQGTVDSCNAWNGTPPGNWDIDNVFVKANSFDKSTSGFVKVPTLNATVLNSHYNLASPGPKRGCESTSPNGPPPFVFDNNGVIDTASGGSVPSQPVNLTPSTSYTCKTLLGELSWDSSANTLSISGGIYIDGSATISGKSNTLLTYSGIGTIYLTGTFSMKSTTMCAISAVAKNGKDCDFGYNVWKPDQNALIIVAYGYGSHSINEAQSSDVQNCDSITLKGSEFQGALEGKHNVSILTTSQSEGPLIAIGPSAAAGETAITGCANTELADGSVSSSQTNLLTFPAVHFSSNFAPNEPTIPSTLLNPQEESG
jgi:Tfp pilus assembly protein PilX